MTIQGITCEGSSRRIDIVGLMKMGLFAINYGTCADPETAVRVARHAEANGFESVWTGEHIVLPLRSPAVLAKELASVDVVSGGRLIAGFAAGYVPAEFAASGVPLTERGARMDEYLRVLTALWAMDSPEHQGRFVSIQGVDAQPRPLQRPGPPIVVGGEAPSALRRAVTMANGWYGFATTPAEAARHIAELRRLTQEHERPAHLGQLELTVTPVGPLDRATVDQYQELGVDRLVLLPEPEAERGRRHAPVPVDRILHNIDTVAGTFLTG